MPRGFTKWIYATVIVLVCLIVWFAWHSATKVELKRYPLTGKVVTVHLESQTATVHNDNMPGFMEPMNMDYQVKDRDVLSKLKTGDTIHATLVSEGHNVWQLEDVVVTNGK